MQSHTDSAMEAVTNTAIGFVLSMITWQFVALGFGIPMPIGENLQITAIFTVVSLLRSYGLRRLFNGRSVWQALKDRFSDIQSAENFVHDEIDVAVEEFHAAERRAEEARKRVRQLIERL